MRYFYWYLYVLLWFLAFLGQNLSPKNQKKLLFLYCAIWAFVFGFRRHDVGNDTPGYADFFENIRSTTGYGTVDNPGEDIEEGFVFVSRVVNFFTESSTVIFLLIGIGIWYAIYRLYRDYTKTPLLSLLYMMTITGELFYTLEIAVRQTVSVIVIVFGILYIFKSKIRNIKDALSNLWFIIGAFLCLPSITIHRTTGFLVIVLAILYFLKLSKFYAYFFVGFFTFLAIFAADRISQMFDFALMLIGGLSDENVNLLGERYMGDMTAGDLNRTGLIAWALPAIITIFFSNKEKVYSYFFKFYMFSLCLHMLIQFSSMHTRIMTLFVVLGFTASIPEICSVKTKWYQRYLMFGLLYLILCYRYFMNYNVKLDAAVPYYFLWQ